MASMARLKRLRIMLLSRVYHTSAVAALIIGAPPAAIEEACLRAQPARGPGAVIIARLADMRAGLVGACRRTAGSSGTR